MDYGVVHIVSLTGYVAVRAGPWPAGRPIWTRTSFEITRAGLTSVDLSFQKPPLLKPVAGWVTCVY